MKLARLQGGPQDGKHALVSRSEPLLLHSIRDPRLTDEPDGTAVWNEAGRFYEWADTAWRAKHPAGPPELQ